MGSIRTRVLPGGQVTGAGKIVRVGAPKIGAAMPDPDGQHLWCAFLTYRVDDPACTGSRTLDLEHLLSVDGPACWHCEQPYTAALDPACPGQPPLQDNAHG